MMLLVVVWRNGVGGIKRLRERFVVFGAEAGKGREKDRVNQRNLEQWAKCE